MSTNILPADVLSPGANLEAYIQAVNSIPMLSKEEEAELANRLYHEGDLDAARQLVLGHMRFVVYVARSYSGYGLSEADLIQEGNVGLMKAVKRFNPEYGVRLVSFAVHWIKAEMHEYILKNWRIVKVATTKAQRKLFFNLRSSKQSLGWMNDQEVRHIAGELDVDPSVVRQMEGRLASRDEAFDAGPEDDELAVKPSQFLSDEDADPADIVELQMTSERQQDLLKGAFAELDDRAREIIRRRWLMDEKSTLHELADEFSISAERVRQLEQNAPEETAQEYRLLTVNQILLALAALSGFISVAMGAFGAHGLREKLAPNLMSAFETGVLYQFIHSLAVIACCILAYQFERAMWFLYAAIAFLLGILLFSGSLYGLALTNMKWLGPVTPVGGLLFLAGWALMLKAAVKHVGH